MKTIIRLALLVALLCAFQPNQASAQPAPGVNPHPQTMGVFFHFFWGSNHPLSDPTGQGGYIVIFSSQAGMFVLQTGVSKKEFTDQIGGPFYTSILIRYGIIVVGDDGIVRPGPNANVVSEEEAAKLKAKAAATGG